MSAVSRWSAGRPQEPSSQPNPGAGFVYGRPPGSRPEGAMRPMNNTSGDWHPTVVNLLVLVLLELVAYACLRYVFREALGS
jgi:hypothetical protein